jgi:CheY-like chemotaxis protein
MGSIPLRGSFPLPTNDATGFLNALKFTEEGFVRLQMRQTRGEAGDAWLAIEVCDSGIGIPEDKRGKVFESFSQVDSSTTRRYGGTGLGLAICRELAARMGGEISVDSTVGEGSTFRVVLPLEPVAGERASRDEASPQPAATVPVSPPPAATPSARVLVVEDGVINQEVIVGVLEMCGHKTEVAGDGAEAVERTREATFDICFMDVDMPKMDGIEATQVIRREMTARGQTHLPIVAMTAHSGEAIEAKCRDAGMDAHLSKPIQPAALAEMIARVAVSV